VKLNDAENWESGERRRRKRRTTTTKKVMNDLIEENVLPIHLHLLI
jgi:hypothetical protein